jgi:membrane protease YdiL (CAAX protease family)
MADDTETGPEPAADVPPGPAGPTGRAVWWEVAAVLAVGVVPNLVAAVGSLYHPSPPPPYWLDSVELTVLSGCAILVTLYLIARSGEPWGHFGITRPRGSDAFLGLMMVLVAGWLSRLLPDLSFAGGPPARDLFPRLQGPADVLMMVVKQVANASAEELVTRAYLITRLSTLLGSRGEAVLVAAILFASYHVYQGLDGAVYALLLGLAYGVAFLAIGRLLPLVIGHAIYNMRLELLVG